MSSVAVLLAVFAVAGSVISYSGSGSVDSGSADYSTSGSADYEPICDPEDYNMQTPSMPFPTLPKQFSTVIDLSYYEHNVTVLAVEHYDYPGNRVRLDFFHKEDNQSEKDITIFDYSNDEVFFIPDRERNVACGVRSISGHPEYVNYYTFGITHVNGKIHVKSAGDIYEEAQNTSFMYKGLENVRGIQCNRWQSCHMDDGSSYTMDHYFAISNWTFPFAGEIFPVKIEVNERYDDGAPEMAVYSFIAFHSGPDAVPDSAFAVPTGLACVGRSAGKGLPSVPSYFSMLVESQEYPGDIGTVQEFYDESMALYRLDLQFNNTPYTFIHDFYLGVEYIIDRRISTCYVTSLENATMFYDVISGPNDTYNLRSPTNFWRLGAGHNFSYEGVTTLRGIEADAWIAGYDNFTLSSDVTLVNGTVELFYSRPGWNATTVYSYTSDPIPLAINLTGTLVISCESDMCDPPEEYSAFHNIFDFSTDEPDFDVFDTSFCSEPGEYVILSLIIPGHEFGSDLSQLRRSIRLGLSQWAHIPNLQIANIQIVGENGTHIFATLQILTIPSIAQYSDRRSPYTILQMILNATSTDDRLPFTITLPSGESVRPYLLRVNPDCPVPSTTTTTVTTTTTTTTTSSTTATNSTSSSTSVTSTTTATNSTSSSTSGPSPTTAANSTSSSSSAPSPTATAGTTTTSTCIPTRCTSTTTTTVTLPNTSCSMASTTTATPTAATEPSPSVSTSTEGPKSSDCPKSSSSGSDTLSNGAVAGLSIAMFIIGMICALVMVLLVKCWQSRRKTFNLAGSKYSRQENEMEGFAD